MAAVIAIERTREDSITSVDNWIEAWLKQADWVYDVILSHGACRLRDRDEKEEEKEEGSK